MPRAVRATCTIALCAGLAAPLPAAARQPAPPQPAPPQPAPEQPPGRPPVPPQPSGREPRDRDGRAPEPAPSELSIADLVIEADGYEQDPVTGVVTTIGPGRATRGEDEVRGDRMVYDPRTQQVTVEGNVYVREKGREWRALRASYNFQTGEGRAEDVTAVFGMMYLDAREVFWRPGPIYEATRAIFTTCDRRRRHYEFYARELRIIPGVRLIGRHVGFDMFGTRILTASRYTKSLQEEDERVSPYPTLGYSSFNGFFARKDLILSRKDPVWLDGQVQLNTRQPPYGGILAGTPGNPRAVGALFYRDASEAQRARHLRVSRLPEVGVLWGRTGDPSPGRFLPHQVAGVRAPAGPEGRLYFAGQVSGGYFVQHQGEDRLPASGHESGTRLSVQGQAILPRLDLGPVSLDGLRVMGRHHLYGTGDSQSVFGTGVGKRWELGKFIRIGVSRFDQWPAGESPFRFDRIDLRQEWRPAFEYLSPGFNFAYVARIRADNGRLYDQIFSIAKLFHCIEPRINFRTRTGEIELQIRIPGLFGPPRRNLYTPRTIDTGLDLSESRARPPAARKRPEILPPAESGSGEE